MTIPRFRKRLSANDVGTTGGHQGGILIPKGEKELLTMLPTLDPNVKNPDAWLECTDDAGHSLRFRFVYYNNKLHDDGGTRNEYRITHMTGWFRDVGAKEGDEFEISHEAGADVYSIGVKPKEIFDSDTDQGVRIRLAGWRRVH
jgi:hypothetical protein